VTHHHGDHSAGLGYKDGSAGPLYVTTTETRQRLGSRGAETAEALAAAQLVEASTPTVIDLGARDDHRAIRSHGQRPHRAGRRSGGAVRRRSPLERLLPELRGRHPVAAVAGGTGAGPEAAKTFALPPALGEWTMFGSRYAEVALSAWERELRP
jgi:hypothetical protein